MGQAAAGREVADPVDAAPAADVVRAATGRLPGFDRIDDLSLVQFRDTVDPLSPAIVLFSPSGTANPYYAEFGWVGAAGSSRLSGYGCSHPTSPFALGCRGRLSSA